MINAELDQEYFEHFECANVDGWAPRCLAPHDDQEFTRCERPPGHDGQHAAVIYDPDAYVNDWVTFDQDDWTGTAARLA